MSGSGFMGIFCIINRYIHTQERVMWGPDFQMCHEWRTMINQNLYTCDYVYRTAKILKFI